LLAKCTLANQSMWFGDKPKSETINFGKIIFMKLTVTSFLKSFMKIKVFVNCQQNSVHLCKLKHELNKNTTIWMIKSITYTTNVKHNFTLLQS
jgi:hypothetical protein